MEIKLILIANRGEIAVRISRAARELGIQTLAIYSDLDGPDAFHCSMADRSVPLEGSGLDETYLDIDKIVSLAVKHGAQAIHPGYGFLSENHLFAEACEKNDIVFIGPSSELIRLMGNKIEARAKVAELGIPIIGGESSNQNMKYPLLVKAAAGGGGKGMRIVNSPEELSDALETTKREAGNYFGNPEVFLEKYIDPARHIEFQVLGDDHGNYIHLYERECSIQRRYQKIIEESPSVWLKPETRQKMAEASLKITKELKYTSAGTIEYLVDEDQDFYFLEMNTRIQVEHPVTEMVTDVDLIKEQIRIAMGSPLSYRQEDIRIEGHAMEARIYAEDPSNGFMPSPGYVSLYREARDESIRVDSSLGGPAKIFPEYDPMVSKLIVWGRDRTEARKNLSRGLTETSILGIETNINLLREITTDEEFIENRISTQYCDNNLETLVRRIRRRTENADRPFYISAFLAGSLLAQPCRECSQKTEDGKVNFNPWRAIGYWRQCSHFRFTFNGENLAVTFETDLVGHLKFHFEGRVYEISGIELNQGELGFSMNGEIKEAIYIRDGVDEIIDYHGIKAVFRRWDSLPELQANTENDDTHEHNDSVIVSPMYGKIIKINVKEKDSVNRGDVLLAIDSMKIENNIIAPRNAKIEKIVVQAGEQVEVNKPLLLIE
jgi:3-methylcrotonyl-CoA carboxylase alpha subunit